MADLMKTNTKSTFFPTKKQMRFLFLFPLDAAASTPAAAVIHLNIYMNI